MISDKLMVFLLRLGRLLPVPAWSKACGSRIRTYAKKGNQVVLIYPDGQRKRCPFLWLPRGIVIDFHGNNNTLEFEVPSSSPKEIKQYLKRFHSLSFIFYEDGNCCHFGVTKYKFIYEGSSLTLHNAAKMTFGRNFCLGHNSILYANGLDGAEFTVGDDCAIAGDAVVRNDDAHTIFDVQTRDILNRPRGLRLGNHVWVTFRCTLLKGTSLPDNTIVGCGTICTKAFTEPNTIIAGMPPRVVRRGVSWSISSISEFQAEQAEQSVQDNAERVTTDIDAEL